MKKIVFSALACLTLAGSAFAGHEMVRSSGKESKAVAPEPCFRDHELQLDVFASYTATQGGGYSDGFGGGLAVNYFFTRMIGVGIDGNVFDGEVNGVWDTTARVIVRFPIENGICIAPYLFGGGGAEADGELVGTLHVGGGLEWRASHNLGIFTEGRYTWADGSSDNDAAQARLGVRFVF
jgi:hypothetical protein